MTQKDKEIIENLLNKKEPVIEFFEVQAIASMMYEICKRFEEKDTNIHINISVIRIAMDSEEGQR